MQDTIVREITVKASKERVYKAITDPKEIITWFPDAIEGGTLEVGQQPVFFFSGENHRAQTHIEAARPFDYFAYRWVARSGAFDDILTMPNTLVEFLIEELEAGTKVTVRESGFASLPPEEAQKYLDQNSGGWEYMMGRLEKKLN